MAGGSFSLSEKLAVTGAFLALVAMVVGTEDDPGVVVTSQDTVRELGVAALPATAVTTAPQPAAAPPPQVESAPPQMAAPPPEPGSAEQAVPQSERAIDPELGRAPLDFSNGPPST